ncbi:biotin-independent malonate decarboxylase subunit gamma [Herbaspirillum huttiense]|jgi:malonate decarboxylase gamma subunit|uniref:Biotin-independent malonate decarboxylase subunit gamma n=2 Tax=Herbaspirillum huttiense TaxID=863372 RepID=A0AAJ2H4H6_9BURK|nr:MULTISPECIES: biotin-independent malonate decarboxylase subunit gamma [Herbaspirillum]MDR9836527.1 biotin-independent malonate decarboxylase subunit gamma [Herbaspirillum huttiense]UWE14383.1 biotin-independent malonate decarboxylase subunit gamma [Herbaspirillum huttiense]
MNQTVTPPQVDWRALAQDLFPQGHAITEQDHFLSGTAQVDGRTVTVVGTTGHTPIGIEIALAQASAILQTVREHPGRPIVILVDTQGQRLRHRDEMLGINSYMAHLGKCVELARRQGHRVVGLVYDQALSGGFITSGLIADACYALPEATIRVMGLPAMARITKVPEERLTELAKSNPVFAPGPENYLRMGGVAEIWNSDLAKALADALAQDRSADTRAATGLERGGRKWAQRVIDAVANDTPLNG